MRRWALLGAAALGLATSASAAGVPEALQSWFAEATRGLPARGEIVEVRRMPQAPGPFKWALPRLAGWPERISLLARDASGARWYVPVVVRWRARAVVAARALPAQTVLTAADLALRDADVTGKRAWVDDPAMLVGARVLRPLAPGEVVDLAAVQSALWVRRGEPVQLIARIGGVEVRTQAKALQSAARAQAVWVRNLKSGRRVQGRVVAPRVVEVVWENGR